eukprot:s1101_g7.t1
MQRQPEEARNRKLVSRSPRKCYRAAKEPQLGRHPSAGDRPLHGWPRLLCVRQAFLPTVVMISDGVSDADDLLLGAACASGWPSLNSYAGDSHSGLLDGTRCGLLEEARFEHAADSRRLTASSTNADGDFAHENLVGVPMLVIYGSKDDDNVPPTQPRNMVRLLESAGQKDSTVTAVELPGVGHWFGQDEPSLAKWFQERLNTSGDLRLPELPEYFDSRRGGGLRCCWTIFLGLPAVTMALSQEELTRKHDHRATLVS